MEQATIDHDIHHGVKVHTRRHAGAPMMRLHDPDPCALVIFGATGDLAHRKLIPALYNLANDQHLPDNVFIVGFSRSEMTDEEFRKDMHEATGKFSRSQPLNEDTWQRFAERLYYIAGTFDDATAYAALRDRVKQLEEKYQTQGNNLFYLATPADAFSLILNQLHGAGLITTAAGPEQRPWSRVIVEKPFGHDLASAKELNHIAAQSLDESQMYRIDHYLGKETVQNILVFRFGNSIFEPLWNRKYIDHVQITAAEEIGIEGRGKFYEQTGVVRDIVQNHLLQVLSLCAMEAPASFSADDIREEKSQVFRSIRPLTDEDEIRESVVLGQYRGYHAEPDVDPSSRVPTYVAMQVMIDNWRWQGVPFYIRAGKRMKKRLTEVTIHFQPVPLCLFPIDDECQQLEPNVLVLRIQPNEGIDMKFICKVPGDELSVGGVTMSFDYAHGFKKQSHEAYERLLLDAMRGDATLYSRRDMVERTWQFITPVLEAWEGHTDWPIATYEPGSDGPVEAEELVHRDDRRWVDLA